MDLDAHISLLLSSGASSVAAAQRNASNYKVATRPFPRVTPTANQWDYKNIIEKLQVRAGCPAQERLCKGCSRGASLPVLPTLPGKGLLSSAHPRGLRSASPGRGHSRGARGTQGSASGAQRGLGRPIVRQHLIVCAMHLWPLSRWPVEGVVAHYPRVVGDRP